MSLATPEALLPENTESPENPENSEHEAVAGGENLAAPATTEARETNAAAEPSGTSETLDAPGAPDGVSEAADDTSDDTADEAPGTEATFSELGLPDTIVRKLAANGVVTPFPIQAATIPDALAGKDILGRGRTGSGKTLSFGLPALARLAGGRTERKRPRGVILTPTRELAMQVADALQPYGEVLGLKFKVVCGGTSMSNQIYALERGVDILVATPGRLRDVINRGACSLDDVEIAVLDEADQMADLGFLPEVTELLDQVPSGGQRMLFSATLEHEIDTLVKRYLVDPVSHEVDAAQGAVTTMSHHVLVVKPRDKAPVTAAIAGRKGRTIVFVRTQLGADRIADQLREAGVKAEALHGGMTQGARTRTLADFKDSHVKALVATDVAARGIHVDGIDLVLNVDPAGDHKDYLHRSGRTARAGQSGTVVSLALPHQRRTIFRLMEDAGVDAARHIIGPGSAFGPELTAIMGARSLAEVQAVATSSAALQAEREVAEVTKELERLQRRAAELREEADRLIARAARDRGDDPAEAVANAAAERAAEQAAAEAVLAAEAEAAAVAAEQRRGRGDRRDGDRGERYDRNERGDRGARGERSDRGGFRRDDRDRDRDRERRPYERRDGERGGFHRDDRDRDRDRGSYERRDSGRSERYDRGDRGGFRRDDRERRSFDRRDGDRGERYDRNERGDRGARGERSDRGGFRRDDRDRDRERRPYERRDGERGGFNREDRDRDRGYRPYEHRDGDRSGVRRDDGGRDWERRPYEGRDTAPRRGSDRPFNRDRRDEHRPYGRRDDHRGGPRGAGFNGNTAGRPFDRRADKPRWKRNG